MRLLAFACQQMLVFVGSHSLVLHFACSRGVSRSQVSARDSHICNMILKIEQHMKKYQKSEGSTLAFTFFGPGASWGRLGGVLWRLGSVLGASWERLGSVLGASLGVLGESLERLGAF